MHERRFSGDIERLRDPQRVARLEINRVVDLALENMPDAQTVLDVGTGSGLFAEQFASRGLAVSGLDVNPEMLAAAKEFVPEGIFKEGIAENIPFEANAFDLVFMGLLLHETDDLQKAFGESFRVTRRRLAILEWPDMESDFGPPREHRLSFERIEAAARSAGFVLEDQLKLAYLVLYRYKIT